MTVKAADYSGGYPGGAALRAAGFAIVIRYVGLGSPGKRITAAEYRDLVANGIQVLLVAELGVHDAEGGYPAGVVNAQAALADARRLGIPDSVGIAAACDEHLTTAQITTCVDYVRGFHDVLGQGRTGAYGFAEFVDAVHAQGYAGWWWKAGAAPTAAESTWVSFWQQNTGTQTVNHVAVDIDLQYHQVGTPTPPLKGSNEDMWKFLVDSGTIQTNGTYTRCAELRPDGTLIGCDWLDIKAKIAENNGLTASVRGVPTGQYEDYVANSNAVKASTAALISLPAALAKISVGASAVTPDQLAALEQGVASAVTAAVSGLSLAVSPADVAVIARASADATATLFATRLAA